ncbi:MAG: tyrosine-type recombinase/integrase [Clostridiaceae bacterium]|nr:tyrosine-type recombinase/integrase [Clostridiaceae bacterium]
MSLIFAPASRSIVAWVCLLWRALHKRHSFATHLVEAGTSIYHIQQLMGHTSLKTTSVYVHISRKDILQVRSPFDSMVDF